MNFSIISDDYFWKKLFRERWSVAPGTGFRTNSDGPLTWPSEYRRLHLIEQGKPWVTYSVHMDPVVDLTFSHSGKYFCTASKELIAVWFIADYESKSIKIINKLIIRYNCDQPRQPENRRLRTKCGISYTSFNSTDDLLLVNGLRMVPNADEFPLEEYKVLIYSFPELSVVRKLENTGENDVHINPSWFGQVNFVIVHYIPNVLFDFQTMVTMYSVLHTRSKTLIYFPHEFDNVEVINHSPSRHKMLVFSFHDEEILEDHDDFSHDYNNNSLAVLLVISQNRIGPHTCEPTTEPEWTGHENCCIDSTFASPDLDKYHCVDSFKKIMCINAVIRTIKCEVALGKIGVACRPFQIMPEGPEGPEAYFEAKAEFRIYDLELNLLRTVNLAPIVPPSLFLSDYDSSSDQHCMTIFGDLNPSVLHYYDYRYNVFVKKETGHFEKINSAVFNPKNSNFLVSVSDDFLIKFWNVTSSYNKG